jgi:hypothetical protein
VTGVIGAKVDAQLIGCAQPVQGLGHGNQGFDIGHAQQAEADGLPGERVDAVVGAVQGLHHRQRRLCKAFGGLLAILRQGAQGHTSKAPARCPLVGQLRQALLREGLVRGAKLFAAGAHAVFCAELIDPQHGAAGRPLGRTLGVVLRAALQIGLEQGLHQIGRQGGRRQQHAGAEQAGPVHQPGECGQVVQVEVVGLVEHQITAHQAQQRRDLPAAAVALGGRHQVVDGADEHRGLHQLAKRGVLERRLQERVAVGRAFELHRPGFVQGTQSGLGATVVGLLLLALEQGPVRAAAGQDRQLPVAELQALAERAARSAA